MGVWWTRAAVSIETRATLETVIKGRLRRVAQVLECVGGVRLVQAVANRSSHRAGAVSSNRISLCRVLIAELGSRSRGGGGAAYRGLPGAGHSTQAARSPKGVADGAA